jgi:hypothetical protein
MWFKHLFDTRKDKRIQLLIKEYGFKGYGLYFALLETCQNTVLFYKPELICEHMGISRDETEFFIDYCANIGLLSIKDNKIFLHKLEVPNSLRASITKSAWIRGREERIPEELRSKPGRRKSGEKPTPEDLMDIDFAIKNWNDFPQNIPVARNTKRRTEKFYARKVSVQEWEKVITNVINSDFLQGKNARGWKISFDWLIYSDDNFAKVLEGKYNQNKKDTAEEFGREVNGE